MNDDIFTKGHFLFNDNIVENVLDNISNYEWYSYGGVIGPTCRFIDLNQNDSYFLKISNYIGKKYVSNLLKNYKLKDFCIWNGVDPETEVWHSDDKVGYTFSFLCYLNDLNENTGGSISFRSVNDKEKEYKIYPKKNDIVIMNHSSSWEHKVEEMKNDFDRFVFHIGYEVK